MEEGGVLPLIHGYARDFIIERRKDIFGSKTMNSIQDYLLFTVFNKKVHFIDKYVHLMDFLFIFKESKSKKLFIVYG